MDELKELRNRIDALDEEIVKLLNKRFEISLLVGEVKAKSGRAVLVSNRETEIRERLRLFSNARCESSIQGVYSAVFEESRRLQGNGGDSNG